MFITGPDFQTLLQIWQWPCLLKVQAATIPFINISNSVYVKACHVNTSSVLLLVMCRLGLEALSQPKPALESQPKPKQWQRLMGAHGSGFTFSKPEPRAWAAAWDIQHKLVLSIWNVGDLTYKRWNEEACKKIVIDADSVEERGLCYGVERRKESRSGTSQNPQTPTPNLTPTKNNKSHVL